MLGLSAGNAKTPLVLSMMLGLVVLVAGGLLLSLLYRGSGLEVARDFEECIAALPAGAPFLQQGVPANDAPESSMIDCNARFAGRRKPGGGYTYYDFMQDRSFDIAGPNPTAEESRRIDREYVGYLDMQRHENIAAELAKRQDDQLRADLERAHQPAGRPLVLTPKILSAQASKPSTERTKPPRCDDNALTCGWLKLSAAVKDAFASSSKTRP
jgi:hypothetical protein